ncbi:MAG TPA: DUF2231 domain-containing protein [Actinoplanes sp.]
MGTVNGLPAHVLLVHAIVVLLPLSALLLVLTALWPAARTRLATSNAILSLIVVVLVPITTSAGEWLERRIPGSPLLHDHTELGDTAIWVAIPVAVVALVIWWRNREATAVTADPGTGHRTYLAPLSVKLTRAIAGIAVVVAVIGTYDIYRIGDSGAKAAWTGQFSSTPAPESRPGR